MLKIYSLIILLTFALLTPTQASAMRFCDFSEKPKFSVKTASTKTRYIRGESARHLTSRAGHQGNSVGGLATSEMGVKVVPQFEIQEHKGRFCVALKKMKVVWLLKPEIYIASNFQKGSCEYSAVLAHEQEHLRRTRKFVRRYAPKFKKKVKKISKTMPTQMGPFNRRADVEKAMDDMLQNMLMRSMGYLEGIMPILVDWQAKVDTPEEYAKVFKKCKNWDKKYALSR